MATKSVAIRLGTEGKAQVQNDFADVRKAGKEASEGIAADAEAAAERSATATERAAQRQKDTWAKLAAAGVAASKATASQSAFNSVLGVNGPKATDNGAGFSALAAQAKAEDDAAASALKLRAALDPLWAAQKRYDDEIANLENPLVRAALGEDLYAQGVAESARRLREAEQALTGHSNGLGLNRMQFVVGASAVHRFADSILAGTPPMRAFMMQAGDLATVLQMDDGGVAGGLAKVRALINPVTVGFAAATAVVAIGTAAWLSYANAVDKLNAISQGAGRVIGATGSDLEATAEAAAKAGNISVSAARDIETSYVKMGGIGKDVLGGLTALTKNFAAAVGEDSKAAVQQLGAAFQDPVKGADELAAKYGLLSQAQVEHIKDLVEQNDLYGAQKALLLDLQKPLDGAADHVNILARAWHAVETAASDAWTAMGKAIDRALGGGTTAEHIADLQQQRALMLASNGNGAVGDIDRQIADLQKQLHDEAGRTNAAAARSKAVGAMAIVDSATGDNSLGDLKTKLAQINGVLADNGKAAGLTAEQVTRARVAQDEYTHAVKTYLPEGEKAAKIATLDGQIQAAKTPAEKASLTAQKTRIEQSGKLITAAQAEAEANGKGAAALATASRAGENHAATLARQSTAMEVSARAALDVADAYLKSSAAGVIAEERRKALTDATRRGADVDAIVQRQLALGTAEATSTGAKNVAHLRDEAAAREQVNADVASGKISVDQMTDALAAEAAVRELRGRLALTTEATARQRIIDLIADETAALDRLNAASAHSDALKAGSSLDDRIASLRLGTAFAGDQTGARELAQARLAAEQQADAKRYSPDDKAGFIDKSVQAKQAELDGQRADYLASIVRSQANDNELIAAQLRLVGATDAVRQQALDKLRTEQDLLAHGVDLRSEEAQKILAGVAAQDQLNIALAKAEAGMSELRNAGTSLLDDVLDTNKIKSWGDVWHTVVNDVKNELIKLALLNPLKNLINGNNNLPGIGSLLGGIGSLFGGGGGATMIDPGSFGADDAVFSELPSAGFNAAGTENWGGGRTWVAENGPELINLPRGSKVTPAAQTRQLLAANNNGGETHNHFHLEGAVVTQDLLDQMNAIGDQAATRGAYGGAMLSEERSSKRAARYIRR